MTTNTDTRDAGPVQVTSSLAWEPNHGWDSHSTHVDGHLSDGTDLDVSTLRDHDLPRAAEVAARNTWLHGRVLTAHVTADAPETLVLPTPELEPAVIAEAVLRRRYGHIVELG